MIYIKKEKKEPLYLQIYQQIRDEILNGTLKEETVLVGSRALAKTLHVSRNTIDNAYGQLAAEGYISPRKGIGYIVTKLPDISLDNCNMMNKNMKDSDKPEKTFLVANETHYTQNNNNLDIITHKHNDRNIIYDLTNSSHTSDLFPKALWKRYTLECIERLDQEEKISCYLNKQGEYYLRHNLLQYLKRIRGVHCNEDQVIITAGIQQSLDIICKLMPDKVSGILMEEPGYYKAAAVFVNNGLPVITVPIDENGIIIDQMPESSNLCAIYSTPSHQFPTGVTMPIGRRLQLLEWAKKNKTYIIEDDYDSELRYYSKPVPSLQSIDREENVIYLGTFSKALSPSIRMGYLILPTKLLETYQIRFKDYNCTAPLLNQYVIARLIETGQYDRHVRRLNNIFKKRLDCFLKEFSGISNSVQISGNGTGQYFLLKFAENVNQQDLIHAAKEKGVIVYPTMQFWQEKADCPPNTLFLGFSKIDLKDIPDCVNRLKEAWTKWL